MPVAISVSIGEAETPTDGLVTDLPPMGYPARRRQGRHRMLNPLAVCFKSAMLAGHTTPTDQQLVNRNSISVTCQTAVITSAYFEARV